MFDKSELDAWIKSCKGSFRIFVMLQTDKEKSTYIKDTIERCCFFRDTQVWPSQEVNFEGWLNNFTTISDKYIAAVILSAFCYYPKAMVNKLLQDAIGKAGKAFSQKRSTWNHDSFKKHVTYSFIPGEDPNPTDSGFTFLRKLKLDLNIDESRCIDFLTLVNRIENGQCPDNMIFVDDIIGSGHQCLTAIFAPRNNGIRLYDFIQDPKYCFAYAPLLANVNGVNKIEQACPNLLLTPAHTLDKEYNLLDQNCFCWQGDSALYNVGLELIFRKSAEYEIPNNTNPGVIDTKGYQGQGLAIAFEHGVPDAILAFFYYDEKNWTPLVRRPYERIHR